MTETRTQQLIRAAVGKHFSGFPNFQEQEKLIQEVFRFADKWNLDVDALAARAAAHPDGEAATPEVAAMVITVEYFEKWTNKTLAQNRRDIARALFGIPRDAKRVLGTLKRTLALAAMLLPKLIIVDRNVDVLSFEIFRKRGKPLPSAARITCRDLSDGTQGFDVLLALDDPHGGRTR